MRIFLCFFTFILSLNLFQLISAKTRHCYLAFSSLNNSFIVTLLAAYLNFELSFLRGFFFTDLMFVTCYLFG